MNSTRCSELSPALAVALVAVVLAATAGTAVALTISDSGVPDRTEVGTQQTFTVTIEDPYTDAPSAYDLEMETDLENVSWTVEERFQGELRGERTAGGQSYTQPLPVEDEQGDQVIVEVTGTVPEVENYTYDPHQNFTLLELRQVTGDNAQTLDTWRVEHYTAESDTARRAIDDAQAATEAAGGNEDAESRLRDAIAFYESGQFEQAANTAQEAQRTAEDAQQSQQTTRLLLIGAAVVVLVLVVVGAAYYWRQQQGPDYKLQ